MKTLKKYRTACATAIAGLFLAFALPLPATAADTTKPAAAQTYSTESTISDLLANSKTKAIIEKYMPGVSTSAQLSMIESMTLQDLSAIPQAGLDDAKLKAIQAELSQVK